MTRVLIIPAAGRGTRLGWHGPKVLYPVAGRPMLGHLLARYASSVDSVVVVTAPDALASVRDYLRSSGSDAHCVIQEEPKGMLPAILCARPMVEKLSPDEVWVTWCDQIAISSATVDRLAEEMARDEEAALVFPTLRQTPPYIHFPRDERGTIVGVLQRREGDMMPESGESDAGLFALRRATYLGPLVEYENLSIAGTGTRERNFLPFIPWLAARALVCTFPTLSPQEAVGINTQDDVRTLEAYLRERI